MMRVMLINDGAGSVVGLRRTLEAAGLHVIAEASHGHGLAEWMAQMAPDVVLVDSDAPTREMLRRVCAASAHQGLAVVMFTADGNRDAIRSALQAGVAAYVVGEVPVDRIRTLLDVAVERFGLERARREELEQARQRLAERQWVDKAKGLLMKRRAVTEDEAYRLLRERAMHTQRRLGDVAREIVEVTDWLQD